MDVVEPMLDGGGVLKPQSASNQNRLGNPTHLEVRQQNTVDIDNRKDNLHRLLVVQHGGRHRDQGAGKQPFGGRVRFGRAGDCEEGRQRRPDIRQGDLRKTSDHRRVLTAAGRDWPSSSDSGMSLRRRVSDRDSVGEGSTHMTWKCPGQ